MERIITRFVTALREKGVRVSPGESLDAVQALAFGGLEGRGEVRSFLRLTLVKNVNQMQVFDEVFDRFFGCDQADLPGVDAADLLNAMIHIVEGERLKDESLRAHHENDGPRFVTDGEIADQDLQDLLNMEESDDSGGAEITVQLDGYRGKMEAPMPSDYYRNNSSTVAFHQAGGTPLPAFTPEELADMQEVVSRMIVRLRKDVRRVQEKQSRGRLHVIRTIQKNYRHGMVPFLLSLRRKLKEKPRLVVLCDVSYSVSHASRFMLLLLHTLHNRLVDVRSFVFNKEIAEITDLLRNMPVNTLLETIDKGDIVNLDDNSDYGNVFLSFKRRHLERMRGKPAFIILGDARNNYNDANEWALEEIREKAGYMLWLTPEERDTWKRGDCLIELYGSCCDRVEVVQDVDELSTMVEDLFRTFCAEPEPAAAKRVDREPEETGNLDYYGQPIASGTANCTQASPSSKEWLERYGIHYSRRR